DSIIRKANYIKLAPFAVLGAKVVISCRPAYFISKTEIKQVFSYLNDQIGFDPAPSVGRSSAQARTLASTLHNAASGLTLDSLAATSAEAIAESKQLYLSLFDSHQIRAYLRKHEKDIVAKSRSHLTASA